MLRAPICCVGAPLPVLTYTNTGGLAPRCRLEGGNRSGSHFSLHLGLLAIFEMGSNIISKRKADQYDTVA